MVVGRDRELEAIAALLDPAQEEPRVLLVEGEAGIGKTTLWRAAVDRARGLGFRVLACSGVESETQLSFTGLRDLLEDAFDEVADELPAPQRRALAVVLLREDVGQAAPAPETVAVAFRTLLRALAARGPTMLAVDDVQWLDRASFEPLRYTLRRLETERLAVLLSQRTGGETPTGETVEVLPIRPLSIGALGRILHRRLAVAYPRPTLRRIHEASGGNPFFALELARSLEASPELAAGAAMSVPTTLYELVDKRLTALPSATLEALTIAAALSRPTLALVSAALGVEAAPLLGPAVANGVADAAPDEIRFAHPLFAAAAYGLADSARRRELHGRLAAVVDDIEERARHLALSTEVPDEEVASALEAAARRTRTRGDRVVCAQLFEAAARVTPAADTSAQTRRKLAGAAAIFEAGDSERARELLEPLVENLGEGRDRVEARWRLGTVLVETGREGRAMGLWRQALAAAEHPDQVADLRGSMAVMTIYVGDVEEAVEHADEAIAAAEASADPERRAYALGARALAGAVAGDPSYQGFVERALALEPSVEAPCSAWAPRTVAAECARVALELEEALRQFRVVLEQALATGNAEMEQWAEYGLATVLLLTGDHRAARAHAETVFDLADTSGVMRLPAARLRGELHAHVGEATEARGAFREVIAEGARLGEERYVWQARVALGALELSLGDTASAAGELRRARRLADAKGMRHAAIVLPLVDEVEAASTAGLADQAKEALAAARALRGAPPAADALVLRATAAVSAGAGDLSGAEAALEQALAAQEGSELRLQRARTLLALGSVRRRLRRRATAREALERALAELERLEAVPWAEQARAELARIGGRAPAGDELTPTEGRIAGLVAEGKTNKEVAAILVVADRTVESALTQIYRKLGVRSRTELARKLGRP